MMVNALQIAQVLNLNFGGNFHELTLAATNKIASLRNSAPVILKGPLFQGRKTGSKNGLPPPTPSQTPKPLGFAQNPKS